MPDERRVVIPAGFINILIEVEETISPSSLAYVPSVVIIQTEEGEWVNKIALKIGSTQTITLTPGKYFVTAKLGTLESEGAVVEVKPGQVEKLLFHFGKAPQ